MTNFDILGIICGLIGGEPLVAEDFLELYAKRKCIHVHVHYLRWLLSINVVQILFAAIIVCVFLILEFLLN